MKTINAFLAAGALALSTVSFANGAENVPRVVSGNTHMLIGVKYDAAALGEILPEGLEAAEGASGGIQVYSSNGGAGVAAYTRTYAWVDLAGYDSLTGNKGRYILWLADTVHAEKMGKLGYITSQGEVSLDEANGALTGKTMVDGAQIWTGSVDGGDCGAGTGTINYPSVPTWAEGMAVTQYAFAGKFCGATLTNLEITAPDGHTLAKLKPESAGWAAVARELSFSQTPAMALPKAE